MRREMLLPFDQLRSRPAREEEWRLARQLRCLPEELHSHRRQRDGMISTVFHTPCRDQPLRFVEIDLRLHAPQTSPIRWPVTRASRSASLVPAAILALSRPVQNARIFCLRQRAGARLLLDPLRYALDRAGLEIALAHSPVERLTDGRQRSVRGHPCPAVLHGIEDGQDVSLRDSGDLVAADRRANVLLEDPPDLSRPFGLGRRIVRQIAIEELVDRLDLLMRRLLGAGSAPSATDAR